MLLLVLERREVPLDQHARRRRRPRASPPRRRGARARADPAAAGGQRAAVGDLALDAAGRSRCTASAPCPMRFTSVAGMISRLISLVPSKMRLMRAVALVALDRVVGGEAVAAEDLQRLVGDEVERLGAEHLQDRRLDRVLLDRLAATSRFGASGAVVIDRRRRRRPSDPRCGSSCCRRRRCASPCRRACAGSCRSSRSGGRTAGGRARSRARCAGSPWRRRPSRRRA